MKTPEWVSKRQEAKLRYIQVEEEEEEDAWQWSPKRYRRRGKR